MIYKNYINYGISLGDGDDSTIIIIYDGEYR